MEEATGKTRAVELAVTPDVSVPAVIGIPEWWPSGNRAGVVLAHHTSANMNQKLLVALQEALVAKGFLTVRFNFPYAQQRKRRPDPMQLLERSFRAAVSSLLRDAQDAPAQLVFGGFGLGARVAAQVVAGGVKADALVCIGFPLHPAGRPNQQRADALFRIICPILFVQGTRDANCKVERLEELRARIGAPTELTLIRDADHRLALVKRTSRRSEEVEAQLIDAVAGFLERTTGG